MLAVNRGTEDEGKLTILYLPKHYLQPVKFGQLSLHSSANEGPNGDVSLFFGLSGTGKTTLSADPARSLIGDDEHVWADTGVFNIEGGCYAKCIGITREKEPDIFSAIRFGSILENVVYDGSTRDPDYDDTSITENTRCAYPIEFINNAKIPCIANSQPKNIIYLTCDAFGVLPPVSKLNSEQAQYWFLSGYTSKTPGTEEGVTEPIPTFSTCFGQPFIVCKPSRYATMLAEKMEKTGAHCWLINTGWSSGGFATGGKRCPLKYTRAIIDAIHDGSLGKASFETFPIFELQIPTAVNGVPAEILNPFNVWSSKSKCESEVKKLAGMFTTAFDRYKADCTPEVRFPILKE